MLHGQRSLRGGLALGFSMLVLIRHSIGCLSAMAKAAFSLPQGSFQSQISLVPQVAVYAVLTEEPQRRFSICDPSAAEGSSLKTSIVMELCDRGSLLNNREKIWALMKQVLIWPALVS